MNRCHPCPCGPVIEVPTPQSIYDDTEEDVFASAIESYMTKQGMTEQPLWYADLDNRCWAKFRYRMINSCDTDLWIQLLKDKLYDVLAEHQIYLDAFYELEDKTDFITDDSTSTTEYESEDLPDTPVVEGEKYLSDRGKTTTRTAGARTPLFSLKAGYEERMDLIGKVADGLAPMFLNRWK